MSLYRIVAADIAKLIDSGTLRGGDSLPSVRELCRSKRVSLSTVLKAYETLEAQGLIRSKPRSGFFVSDKPPELPRPAPSRLKATRLDVSDLVFATLQAARDRETVPLGSAFPSPLLFPWQKLARHLGSSARSMDPWHTVESLPPGSVELRREIARRYLKWGITLPIDEIVVTAGALEALNLALETVTVPGDTVAVETPTFYGCLQAVQRLGLNAVEIPTRAGEGIDLEVLKKALNLHRIKACWFMPTLHHPTGATLTPARKKELVRLLENHGVPLIEDDAYAELQFGPRSPPAKMFDATGQVLHCGSFSKCLAPGYRLGWVAAGRFREALARRKMEASIATSLPIQQGVAKMLRHGGFEAHLVKLRRQLKQQQAAYLEGIRRAFPAGIRISKPDGGYFLWVECARSVDTLEVHRRALESGITIAPGPIFSARRQYSNFLRLNCGHPFTPGTERALERIGRMLREF
jgi:DNA-binding transcriptional MocR family regulator